MYNECFRKNFDEIKNNNIKIKRDENFSFW